MTPAKTSIPDLQTLQTKLAGARQEVRNLVVMAMQPGRSAANLKHLHNLERSARAEVKLRVKAVEQAQRAQRDRQ
jgi:hypothetical protein